MKRGFIYTISAFAVSVVFLTSLSFLYTDRLNDYIASRNEIDSSQTLIIQLYRLSYYIREAERAHRSFLLSQDSVFRNQYQVMVPNIRQARDSINKLIPPADDLRMRFNDLNLALTDRLGLLQNSLYASSVDTLNVVENILRIHPVRTRLTEFIQLMEQEESQKLAANLELKRSYERVNRADFQLLFFFALLIFIVSFVVLLREIRLRVIYHRQMAEKIEQINQANKELERITFIASHDLQEPLRKIRTFSDLLVSKHGNELTEEGKSIIKRIEYSADVMHELIRDLANYTNLVNHDLKPEKVHLDEVLNDVRLKFSTRLSTTGAQLTIERLPMVKGFAPQLEMLFAALLDNSLKFSKPDARPEIIIKHEVVKGEVLKEADESKHQLSFNKIVFSDNGLGFDEEFTEKIFGMFQRLHNRDALFSGRGMGLAIAKRVMINHKGYIEASGRPHEGASFHLYFPADKKINS